MFLGFILYEKQTNLIGSWAVELLKSDKNIPICIFKLNIIEQNKRVLGEYFYILNYGNKKWLNKNNSLVTVMFLFQS